MITENMIRKKAINYIRALLTLVILLLAVYKYEEILDSKQYVFLYLIVVLATNVFLWFVNAKHFEGTKFQFWIFLMDIILIVCAAYMLTSVNFYLTLFIFLTIFMASLSQSVSLSLLVAFVVNVVYVYISGNTTGGFAINDVSVLLNVPFIFIVALHSSYFAEKSNEDARDRKNLGKANVEMGVKIKDTDIEIGTLMNFIFRVYDAFKDGVLVTDKNGYVKVFNIAAENIFNTRRSNVTNMHIGDIETLGAVKDTITKLITRKEVTVDKEIIIDSGKLKKISVSTVFIKNKSGDSLGVLCTMRRLTGELEKPQEFK